MKENYESLYIAIWKMALHDEVKKAVETINGYVLIRAYDNYCKQCRNTLRPLVGNKEIEKVKRDIRKNTKSLCAERLGRRIKELIMQETRDWPNNCYLVSKDPEYKKILAETKKEALVYAMEQFSQMLGDGKAEICKG